MDICPKKNTHKKKNISSNDEIQNITVNQIQSSKLNEQEKSSKNIISNPKEGKKLDLKDSFEENWLKIELYPNNIPKGVLEKLPIKNYIYDPLGLSLDKEKTLAYVKAKVPLLEGFYSAHCNHYPIRLKPDDIWLLIVQAFSHHVNINAEKLRNYFVEFEGEKDLVVNYHGEINRENFDRKILEDFSVQINKQIEEYLGEELIKDLTSDFSTTDDNSSLISKISIMGAFKKYFRYKMRRCICGIPYIILEGTLEDYKKIKEKAKKLSKYEFSWYIDRIIPHIEKMIDAKKGNIDINYFKDIIQKKDAISEKTRNGCSKYEYEVKVDIITGWILDFFAYKKNLQDKFERFESGSIKISDFETLAGQMLIVPFTIEEEMGRERISYDAKYEVGFIGCDQNEKKEVFPVQGWFVST